MEASLSVAIEAALGARVARATTIGAAHGCTASRVWLADGRAVFVKSGAAEARSRLEAEAHGLAWLASPGALRVPGVLAVITSPAALVLEWIEPGEARDAVGLGRGLAALHRAGAPCFGLDRDGWLASIPTTNAPEGDWPKFYAERRLIPLLSLARAATPRIRRGVEQVARTMRERVGPAEPPARLHGDLWSGNVLWDARGAPVLVDPAVYGGHREIDLAMMRLFGGFSRATFDAYHEAFPLAPGHEARVPLHQLLPLLAHVVLFGGSYVGAVEGALDELGV